MTDEAGVERLRFAPVSYVLSHTPEELAGQARLIDPLPEPGCVRVAVSPHADPGLWKVDVACRDQRRPARQADRGAHESGPRHRRRHDRHMARWRRARHLRGAVSGVAEGRRVGDRLRALSVHGACALPSVSGSSPISTTRCCRGTRCATSPDRINPARSLRSVSRSLAPTSSSTRLASPRSRPPSTIASPCRIHSVASSTTMRSNECAEPSAPSSVTPTWCTPSRSSTQRLWEAADILGPVLTKSIDGAFIRRAHADLIARDDLSGRGLARRLSDQMDGWFDALGRALPPGWAIVATGGYANGLLCPGSDVDVVLIHPQRRRAPTRCEPSPSRCGTRCGTPA